MAPHDSTCNGSYRRWWSFSRSKSAGVDVGYWLDPNLENQGNAKRHVTVLCKKGEFFGETKNMRGSMPSCSPKEREENGEESTKRKIRQNNDSRKKVGIFVGTSKITHPPASGEGVESDPTSLTQGRYFYLGRVEGGGEVGGKNLQKMAKISDSREHKKSVEI